MLDCMTKMPYIKMIIKEAMLKREALLRELRTLARKMGVEFEILQDKGKGSHYRVKFAGKMTTIQSGELDPKRVSRIKKQLGL